VYPDLNRFHAALHPELTRCVVTFTASIAGNGLGVGVLVTAFTFGFRHGIDWDHLAAITDITGTQERARRSIGLATVYALGHAAVVFALGVSAIVFSEQLPHRSTV